MAEIKDPENTLIIELESGEAVTVEEGRRVRIESAAGELIFAYDPEQNGDELSYTLDCSVRTAYRRVEEGKRRYVVRTDNELSTIDRINELVLRSRADATTGRISRVTVADVANTGA